MQGLSTGRPMMLKTSQEKKASFSNVINKTAVLLKKKKGKNKDNEAASKVCLVKR